MKTTPLFPSVFFLLLLYNVKFIFLFGVGTFYIVFLILLLIQLFIRPRIDVSEIKTLLLLFTLVLVGVLFSITKNISDFDIEFIRFYIFIFLSVILSPLLYAVFNKNYPGEILKYIGGAVFINALFILIMFVSPSIRDFYLSLLRLEVLDVLGGDVVNNMLSLRLIGVTGFSAYSTAFTQMFGVIIYYIYINEFRPNKKTSILDYLLIFAVILSAFIAARSSIIGVVILFTIMLCDKVNLKKNLVFFASAAFFLSLTIGVLLLFLPPEKATFFETWVFEFFNAGLSSGSVKSNMDMFIYTFSDFSLLGDAKFSNAHGGYYKETDVGYFRLLFGAGYLGLIFMFFFIATIVNPINRKIKRSFYFILILAYIFAYMFKGFVIYDTRYIFLVLIVVMLSFKNKEKNIRNGH